MIKVIRETKVEHALKRRVESLGGTCEKFESGIYGRGRPDRLVTLPGGKIYFVETKRPKGGKLSALQLRDHRIRRGLGCDVRVIWTVEQAKAFPDFLDDDFSDLDLTV